MAIRVTVGNQTYEYKSPWQAVVQVAFKACAIKGAKEGVEPQLVEKVKKILEIAERYTTEERVKSRRGEYVPAEVVRKAKMALEKLFSDEARPIWEALEEAGVGKGLSVIALRMLCTGAVLRGVILPLYKKGDFDKILDFVKELHDAGILSDADYNLLTAAIREAAEAKGVTVPVTV